MDYETVLEEQLEATELSELEDSLADAAQQSGVLEELSVEDLVHRLLNGQQILDSDQILENLKNLFLLEVRSSLMLGCEILAVCILIGMLTSFSDSFGKRTVSSLGTVICSCVIIALCMGNFYQSYEYCQDALGTMAHSMEILLPVMIPLLVAMGGISSGSILDPAVAGAVTGFSALMEHIVLPLVFLSAVFTMINSITEKDYVKKLAGFLRKGAIERAGNGSYYHDGGPRHRRPDVSHFYRHHHGDGRWRTVELMKDWVRSLFLILLAITFIEMLLPESSMGKYLRFIFSLVIMATILYPVIRLTGGV